MEIEKSWTAWLAQFWNFARSLQNAEVFLVTKAGACRGPESQPRGSRTLVCNIKKDLGPIHTGRARATQANGTCWYEWGCPHCTQATSKDLHSNVRTHAQCGLGLIIDAPPTIIILLNVKNVWTSSGWPLWSFRLTVYVFGMQRTAGERTRPHHSVSAQGRQCLALDESFRRVGVHVKRARVLSEPAEEATHRLTPHDDVTTLRHHREAVHMLQVSFEGGNERHAEWPDISAVAHLKQKKDRNCEFWRTENNQEVTCTENVN